MMSDFDWVQITIVPAINWNQSALEWTARMRTMVIDEDDSETYGTYFLYAMSDDYDAWCNRYVWIAPGNTRKDPARFSSKEAAATFARNAFDDFIELWKQASEAEVQYIDPLG